MVNRLGFLEEIAAVEKGIAIELERIAMESVGAGFDDCIQDAAGITAVFGIDSAGDQVEFADSVGTGNYRRRIKRQIDAVRAVDQERILL